jgi:oligopeptidase B
MPQSNRMPGSSSNTGSSAAPPQAARRPHDVVAPWGTRSDEYHWLRDDTREDPQVLAYLAAENAWAEQVLAPLAPLEQELFEELGARIEPEESSVPVLRNGYWYYSRFESGCEHPLHARRRGSMEAPEEIVLDENALAQGWAYFELGDFDVSPDGRLLAYTLDVVGRRQYELRLRDIASGRDFDDRIVDVEPQIVWAGDGRRVLYIEKDPQTLLSVRLKVHALGEAAGADRLLYEEADHSYYLGIGRSRSERYLFLSCSSTEQSEWWYADAMDPQLGLRCVLARSDGHEYEVEHRGDEFFLRSNREAPNFRLVRVPIERCADPAAWADVLAHRQDVFIEDFELAAEHLAVGERAGGLLRLRIRDEARVAQAPDTADILIEPPQGAGSIRLVHTPGIGSGSVRYEFTSLVTPRTTYDFDLASGTRHWRKTQTVLGGFDPARYVTETRRAPARDGTLVPVSIARRRDTPLDGSAPVFQTGYGAYGISYDPDFRSAWVSLMDRGFVVAIAHVRGGQEMGRRWYDEGRLQRKMNTFTDFIDATRMLVEQGVGSAARICAQGGSAGGLLMGAIANLAPERYCAIVAHVPFVDVVTTMLDESLPLTTNEYDQWGDPRRQADYAYLLSYSPYDNVGPRDYPALLVFTGLWDSQVQYFEPAKWVARLRACGTGRRPLLFCVDLAAGHGGRSGRYERLRETAREQAFLLWQVGVVRGMVPGVAPLPA